MLHNLSIIYMDHLQWHSMYGNNVYHYYLTYREYYNSDEEWYGVVHGAEIQVSHIITGWVITV